MGRALRLDMVKYRVLGWPGWVPGIALPVPTQLPLVPTTPGTPPTVPGMATGACSGSVRQSKCGVGLKSVAQLSLRLEISGFRGITEVYNLLYAGNANDHNDIPGNE